MITFATTNHLIGCIDRAESLPNLEQAMIEASDVLGFRFFALAYHPQRNATSRYDFRLHSYPSSWAQIYDSGNMGADDPVRIACASAPNGFDWSMLPHLIKLSRAHQHAIDLAQDFGITDGFTIPTNLPGEPKGSCTFAGRRRRDPARAVQSTAQLVGLFALNRLRMLWLAEKLRGDPRPVLTPRQKECVVWMTRGKSDWEISRVLGISEETVTRHLKAARERYGVDKRTSLAVRTLADRTLSFEDVLFY